MNPVILFRSELDFENEEKVAREVFPVTQNRVLVPPHSLVIGRYSVLPFYRELQEDLRLLNESKLINSYRQHRWIANFDWYELLQKYTPETWFDHDFYRAPDGPFVLKGRTNSRKFQWNTHMYAENKSAAGEVASRLSGDGFIGPQGIIYRRHVPLRTFEVGINDLPFTNEWRLFYFKDECLSFGFYWSSAKEEILTEIQQNSTKYFPPTAKEVADEIAKLVSPHVNFFVLDVAESASGDWILIEINDGQMSGLSENSPRVLYSNLAKALLQFG